MGPDAKFILGAIMGFYISRSDPDGFTKSKWLDTAIFGFCVYAGIFGFGLIERWLAR